MPEKYHRSEVVTLTLPARREVEMKVSPPCAAFHGDMSWTCLPDRPTVTPTILDSGSHASNDDINNNDNNTSSSSIDNNNNNNKNNSCRPSPRVCVRSRGVAGQVSQIVEGLFLSGGRAVRPGRVAELGVTCVVNATTELPNAPLEGVRVVAVRVADDPKADLSIHFAHAADLIHEELCGGGRVLVHCVAGVSRSPALVLAYLVRHRDMALRQAFLHVREVRPSARPNSGFFSQLIEFEREERGCGSVALCDTPGGRVPDVCVEEATAMQDRRRVAALTDRRALQRVYA